jgi:acyl transferase domain-containing protein
MSPLAHLNFFSPDGRCYSFDHRANGYARGEGFGVVVIKRLADALADNDPIRAIIRATGSNENGRTVGGITQVSCAAQESLIRKTYSRAMLDFGETRYVEAHGPGTGGDPIEAAALAAVFSDFRSYEDPLYLGSCKANVGHLEGGSGIAALIKTILVLEQGIIPRLANFQRLNPQIDADRYHFKVPMTILGGAVCI